MRIYGTLTVTAYRDIPDGLSEDEVLDKETDLRTDLELCAQDIGLDKNLSDTDMNWDTDYGIYKGENHDK